MPSLPESKTHHYVTLIALIFAGELIFSLPFHIPRFFRPTLLDVFNLSNTQLGDIFAMYGVVALLSYFPGGTIADRVPPRSLMALSLVATAMGGLYLYTVPGLTGLYLLFAYWGLTTILLFWAALIKATRDWGGRETQGLAFGVLDGGRGLIASIFATLALFILTQRLSSSGSHLAGLQAVILFYSCMCLLAAAVIWIILPKDNGQRAAQQAEERPHWRQVTSEPKVWLQAGVVVCAYCGFKALDNYGVYAVDVLGMDHVQAAELNTYASYVRPVAAVAAGLWADRWRASRLVTLLFLCAGAAFYALSQDFISEMATSLLVGNVMITFVAVYALRAIYFSLIEEAKLDKRITGSAVGLISVIGFTPDIFFASITGRVLDANPGAVGFQNYFLLLAGISVAGMAFTLTLSRQIAARKNNF